MVTIIFAAALLVALTGLGIEIGIASWSIRRAGGYRRKLSSAMNALEQMSNPRSESLDGRESSISWLLNFLYHRYARFSDLEEEIDGGSGDASGGGPGRADLERALDIIKFAVPDWMPDQKKAGNENTENERGGSAGPDTEPPESRGSEAPAS
jgi:hypothetical protein